MKKDDLGPRLREALRRMLLVFDQGNDVMHGAEADTCTFARQAYNARRSPEPVGVMWCEPPDAILEYYGEPGVLMYVTEYHDQFWTPDIFGDRGIR